jgi:hypothetical protein
LFEDENVKVHIIGNQVHQGTSGSIATQHVYYFDRDPSRVNLDRVVAETPGPGGSIGLIVETHGKVTGKFLPKKAVELGVPKGPMFAKLANGESVEVEGRTITPDMVSEPPEPPTVIVIIDIKTETELLCFDFDSVLRFNTSAHSL